MYNSALIQTNYKPYVPLPKKQINKDGSQEQKSLPQSRIIQPNDYSNGGQQQRSSSDTFAKTQTSSLTKININQLLIDFRSTLNAIGASEDVENEVKTYLGLIENQSKKDAPNKKMIVSNLKIAADVLDTYISETLQKPSKVVKDWVDALLLQNIDFKADPSITKGAFESITGEQPQTAKLAEKKLAERQKVQEVSSAEEVVEENTLEPTGIPTQPVENNNIDEINSYIQKAENVQTVSASEALRFLSQAFVLAQDNSDKVSMANIYSKIASVQNKLNNRPQALECLNASTILAYALGLDSLKTQNHKLMAELYDEAGFFDTAYSHYFVSLGIDGKLEDTENQSDTLKKVAGMFAGQYANDDAVEYYKDALELAKVTANLDMMSSIFVGTANVLKNSGESQKAINNLKNAASLSSRTGNEQDLFVIYEKAGDLMMDMNCQKKAADLYKKSYRIAEKLQNADALETIRKKLIKLN